MWKRRSDFTSVRITWMTYVWHCVCSFLKRRDTTLSRGLAIEKWGALWFITCLQVCEVFVGLSKRWSSSRFCTFSIPTREFFDDLETSESAVVAVCLPLSNYGFSKTRPGTLFAAEIRFCCHFHNCNHNFCVRQNVSQCRHLNKQVHYIRQKNVRLRALMIFFQVSKHLEEVFKTMILMFLSSIVRCYFPS